MRHTNEKGTPVTYLERSQKTPDATRGVVSRLGVLRLARGSGAPSSAPALRRSAVMAVLPAVLLLFLAVATAPAVAAGPPRLATLEIEHVYSTRAEVDQIISAEGATTEARLEYTTEPSNPAAWQLFTSLTCTEQCSFETVGGQSIKRLHPSTTYTVRVTAKNSFGEAPPNQAEFTTKAPAAPEFLVAKCGSGEGIERVPQSFENTTPHMCSASLPTPTAASVFAELDTDGIPTEYHLAYSTEENGFYIPVAGTEGSVSVAEDFAPTKVAHLTGLTPQTVYYVRAFASNSLGSATETATFATSPAQPRPNVGLPDNVSATAAHVPGTVIPDSSETHWRFETASSETGPWTPGVEGTIPAGEADQEPHSFSTDLTGLNPATIYYVRLFAENAAGSQTTSPIGFETAGPPAAVTFATRVLDGESFRVLGSVDPRSVTTDAHYHVEYVTQQHFEAEGFANPETSPDVDLGVGAHRTEERSQEGKANLLLYQSQIVGVTLPGLQSGVTYHYRLLAHSEAGVIAGAEQTFTVPVPAPAQPSVSCPNESFRSGLAARLPDCRAYELITPASKNGAQDNFNYGSASSLARLGEGGEHVLLRTLAKYGSDPNPFVSDYVFDRDPTAGWRMTSLTPPGSGEDTYLPEIFSADLSQVALARYSEPTYQSHSADQDLLLGPDGGPYTPVASTPFNQLLENGEGKDMWAAATPTLSKLVVMTRDHALPGLPQSTTAAGLPDLYEYTARAGLAQVNVDSQGHTIGVCGARVPLGSENFEGYVDVFAAHAISEDGSKIFFEAIPDGPCPAGGLRYDPAVYHSHLYMRVNGSETVDIGEYTFDAASPNGAMLLLGHDGEQITFSYDTKTRTLKPLVLDGSKAILGQRAGERIAATVSNDASTVYFSSPRQLTPEAPPTPDITSYNKGIQNWYVFDVASEKLQFIFQDREEGQASAHFFVTADGRFFYFQQGFFGAPGAGPYRYDRDSGTATCIACTAFHPAGGGEFAPYGQLGAGKEKYINGATPRPTWGSDDGRFAFFRSVSELVPQDIDGEEPETFVPPSHSWDVYEWRANGVDGCSRVAGCVALLTNGIDGFRNVLLGTDPSGRDVLIATHSQLAPADQDTAGDLYDVRIDGGFAPPAASTVECEADACSTPPSAPVDATPSSSTFAGSGNVTPVPSGKPAVKGGKPKHATTKKTKKRKHRTRPKKKAGKAGKNGRVKR